MAIINATSAPYDISSVVTNTTNILEFTQRVNDLTGQTFMLSMLLAGFIIMFIATNKANVEPKEALTVSVFITAVLSVSFFALEFISGAMLTIIMIIFGILVAAMALKRN